MSQSSKTHRFSQLALLVAGFAASAAFAANTVEVVDCDEVKMQASEVPAASLTVTPAEHEVDSEVDVPLTAPASQLSDTASADETAVDDVVDTEIELPPTAVQLPGISKENLPRYRRQMYRTDI